MEFYLRSAIKLRLKEMITQMWNASWSYIVYSFKEYGPDCTEEEIKEVIDELVEEKFLRPWSDGWALASLSRSTLRRFCD